MSSLSPMKTLTYERGGEFLEKIVKLGPDGVKLLCPVCGSVLQFAPNYDSAAKLRMHPGILCPKDWKHVSVTFYLRER
jgi:hypothetical protein